MHSSIFFISLHSQRTKNNLSSMQEKWKWQESGTTWKGIGLYHITLTIPDRKPLLGWLDIPDNNPQMAKVRRTPLGNALVDCLLSIPQHHPEVQVLHFCLMPDHLHAVIYVRRLMPIGIKGVVRGFWQAARKLGRAATVAPEVVVVARPSSLAPNNIRGNDQEGNCKRGNGQEGNCKRGNSQEGSAEQGNGQEGNCKRGDGQEGSVKWSLEQGDVRQTLQEETDRLEALSEGLRQQLGDEAYYDLASLFTEMPFIRPMGRNTQLPNTIRYIDMNPQRLATKRLKPGFFHVQREIAIGKRSYDGVGNVALLMAQRYQPVHVRSVWVKMAENGDKETLRNYKNACVMAARQGVVMVSPFISTDEKQVMQVFLQEQLPFIFLTDNGFRDYYKPSDTLFDAVAAGRVLILSPWAYDADKRHISRADCVALNGMAEEICQLFMESDKLKTIMV